MIVKQLILILGLSLWLPSIQAKVALLIGNDAYQSQTFPKLYNAIRDTRLLKEKLTALGFKVIDLYDLNALEMRKAIRKFHSALKANNQVGLFYYAGHALQIDGDNYLVPLNAHISREFEAKTEAINADLVLDAMFDVKTQTNLVILDACRNNIFSQRGGSRGLANMARKNTFIAYATQPGEVADDGIFMEQLIKRISEPIPIDQMFKKVINDVNKKTGGDQIPAFTYNLVSDYCLTDRCGEEIPIDSNNNKLFETTTIRGMLTPKNKDKLLEPTMVLIPGGTFMMGSSPEEAGLNSDERQHRVKVNRFYLSATEITNQQYIPFLNAVKRRGTKEQPWFETQLENKASRIFGEIGHYQVKLGFEQHPVTHVSWYGATAYADWLSRQTGKNYRLPTEAEWEYAARASTTTPFYTGNCINTDQANYNGNYDYNNCGAKTEEYKNGTVMVGSYPPNAFGLYDMVGNVWEWTCSGYLKNYQGQEESCSNNNQTGSIVMDQAGNVVEAICFNILTGDLNDSTNNYQLHKECSHIDQARAVLRGGSWSTKPMRMRSAYRVEGYRSDRSEDVGFRLVRIAIDEDFPITPLH